MNFPNLFSPIKLRGLELKNRIDFPAMGTFFTDGHPNDRMIAYFVARAKGGCALITPEATSVYGPGAPGGFLNLSADEYVPSFKKMTDAVHDAGGKMCVQLWQGGMTPMLFDPKCVPFVPSELTVDWIMYDANPKPFTLPAMDLDTIHATENAFGDAARRAVEAGFDAIEFHLAHGYLPHMFLSEGFNHRADEYGGSFENRCRYSLNCIRKIRKNIPEDMPLIVRIDAHDDYVENGLTIDDVIAFLKLAKEEGVDAVNVSRGNPVTRGMKYEVPSIELERGFNVENASKIRKETGLITIAVGRINSPEQAEEILSSGKADMVVMGRALLSDPEFCNKAKDGREDEIVRCYACGQGCGSSGDVPYFTCARNPLVGKEAEVEVVPTDNPKNVLIIGGGMAGMEAGIVLVNRGHKATIFEETSQTGGQFLSAGLAPRKGEMREAAISRGKQALKYGVNICLNTKATVENIAVFNPDEVIIATGAKPLNLDLPGAESEHVYNWKNILEKKVTLTGTTIVIGGGLVGLEVAEYLVDEGNSVIVLEMTDKAGNGLANARRICIEETLATKDIKIMTNTKCIEIKKQAVITETPKGISELVCDNVVFAIGAVSNDYAEIKEYCEQNSIPYHVIGDAVKARKVTNAVHEAFFTALEI